MVDAAFLHKDIKQGYFFSGTRYARIQWTPGTGQETITFGPSRIADHWPSLVQAGFGTVDAVLPIEGISSDFYFFFGGRVARIKVIPKTQDDTVVEGPLKITDKWKSIDKAGFDTVDAAFAIPDRKNEAYLFKGTKYVRFNYVDDKISYGPAKIANEWPALTKTGFDSVDAAIESPAGNGQAYFFKGTQYAYIKVVASAPDELRWGPKPISENWKTLDWA